MASATMNLSMIVRAFDQASPQLGTIGRNLRSMFQGLRMLNVAINRDLVTAGRGVRNALVPARQELGVLVGHAATLVKTLAGVAAGSAGAGLVFKKAFLGVGDEAERVWLRIRAFEGDDGRADQVVAWLRRIRAETGATMEDLADAWHELRTKNIDPTRGSFRVLANAAAATGAPLSRVAKIFVDALEGKTGKFDDLGIELEKEGNQLVLTYEHMDKRIRKVLDPNDRKGVRAAIEEAITKRYAGATERAANSWSGLLKRLGAEWDQFALQVMSAGVFDALKDVLRDVLAWVERAKSDGTLKAWATDVADGIKTAISGARQAFTWLRTYLPPIVNDIRTAIIAVGGWNTVLMALGVLLAGRVIVSVIRMGAAIGGVAGAVLRFGPALVGVAASVLHVLIPALRALSVALVSTPAGWFLLAVAAIAAAVWLIYDNWGDIDTWFQSKMGRVKAAFDENWLNGIVQLLKEFSPVVLIGEALDGLSQKFLGFSLFDVGVKWAASLRDGIGQGFDAIVAWLQQKLDIVLGPIRAIARRVGWTPEELGEAGARVGGAAGGLAPRAGPPSSSWTDRIVPYSPYETPEGRSAPNQVAAPTPIEGTIQIVVTATDGASATVGGMSATPGIDLAAVTRGRYGASP